jgi:hypothetical protein
MTRRQFDRATKRSMGRGLASDERCAYREERLRPHQGSGSHLPTDRDDFVARRAARMRELRSYRLDRGLLATLGVGSPFRASAAYLARSGAALLAARY